MTTRQDQENPQRPHRATPQKAAYPTGEVALQAVDYFLWARQRVFEKREDRFLELLWPQCGLIVDVDDTREKEYGAYYTKQKPLRAAALKSG